MKYLKLLCTFMVVIVLLTGVLLPSQITFSTADNDTKILTLNVCSTSQDTLSVDSSTPVLVSNFVSTFFIPEATANYIAQEPSYNYISVKSLNKPPYA